MIVCDWWQYATDDERLSSVLLPVPDNDVCNPLRAFAWSARFEVRHFGLEVLPPVFDYRNWHWSMLFFHSQDFHHVIASFRTAPVHEPEGSIRYDGLAGSVRLPHLINLIHWFINLFSHIKQCAHVKWNRNETETKQFYFSFISAARTCEMILKQNS